jgi:superfamily II DNA or RNA helicase
VLQSHHSLADEHFSIAIAGWVDVAGRRNDVQQLIGAVVKQASGYGLLRQPTWETLLAIATFHQRPAAERNDLHHRQAWGRIRQQALRADARLDDFLYRSVVLTPEKLTIDLRRNDIGSTKVIEVQPGFAGAPDNWLAVFDRHAGVPDRYDIPTAEGIVQVLISTPVKTVLAQIKRLERRRVAGSRAEAFVMNPFAALGEVAGAVIDPVQFEQARAAAGFQFDHFTAYVQPDAIGYPAAVGLQIESACGGDFPASQMRLFSDDSELEDFISRIERNLARNLQLCAWQAFEFELLGDTHDELAKLRSALAGRRQPRILIDHAQVYDLSRYASRVEEIGLETAYYAPFIAKIRQEDGWFPENLLPVIAFTPAGATDPVIVPVTPQARAQIEAKLAEARANGQTEFSLAGLPEPIPVELAAAILNTFDTVFDAAQSGQFDPTIETDNPDQPGGTRTALIIKANIQGIDYAEARRDILNAFPSTPQLPQALRPDIALLPHQLEGVARIQHLFGASPEHCRGVVLADDMGLGKTLQLLTVITRAFERDPDLPPALVVAPVSLLENWQEELGKFFRKDSVPLLTVYGDALKSIRVPRANIDVQLKAEGLVKFLVPGWRGNARLVLTTYETLRDLEFSFAEERWSIMVCDEAQRIKNPSAMVTRSAKKQNVRFKIACTGTPVENTLADLWCLFDFVQPGLLGALNEFGQRYRKPIEARTDEEKARVEELRARIAPQVIRRIKADVAKELKPKIERPCRVPISPYQRALYAGALDRFHQREESPSNAPFKNHLGLLHYLRLICTDPRPYGDESAAESVGAEPVWDYRSKAPKLLWLVQTLKEIRCRDEKVIVFCEFRTIQRLLKYHLAKSFGLSPDIINGETTTSVTASDSRQKRIRVFQDSPGFNVLILSPIAVGFGVNIQAANHVIHYTRTWNPAKEDQATDRAYRIGQTREVFVYYPMAHADDFTTFDAKLHELLNDKRKLAQDMLNGAGDIRAREFDILTPLVDVAK